jgi:uncharacterized protein (TIGR02117 family)
MQILYFLLFLYYLPLLFLYLILCFIIPIIKIGIVEHNKGIKIYVYKDLIHSDYIFESEHLKDMFETQKKYIKVGWGDRKIFLETQSWTNLKIKDFLFAFFGLNSTTLRVEHLEELPSCKIININQNQLNVIKNHIKKSHNGKLIKKKKEYYQNGDFYESNLNYNCINTCNNWVNVGLRLSKISNRIWCPITYWI